MIQKHADIISRIAEPCIGKSNDAVNFRDSRSIRIWSGVRSPWITLGNEKIFITDNWPDYLLQVLLYIV